MQTLSPAEKKQEVTDPKLCLPPGPPDNFRFGPVSGRPEWSEGASEDSRYSTLFESSQCLVPKIRVISLAN
ncbi:MAG: hypothetical protein V3T44_04805, partial [bacterium]